MLIYFLIIVVVLGGLFLVYARYVGTLGIFIKEYKVVGTVPDSFDGLKIVHISDVHYGRTIKEKELIKLVNKVNSVNPDIIVITGDILDNSLDTGLEGKNMLVKYFSQLNAKIGKYAVSGNHDCKYSYWVDIINESGFKNVNDTYELIYYEGYEPIVVAGVNNSCVDGTSIYDSKYDYNIDINEKLVEYNKYISENEVKYKILLIHEPDFIDDLKTSFDLVLAGHSHNGQIRFPLVGAIVLPDGSKKYYDEHYKVGNTDLFISSGLGTSGLPFRFLNHPSINFYRITKK